jgi:hypothetical protein
VRAAVVWKFPKWWISARVTYYYWPIQSKKVGFRIEGPARASYSYLEYVKTTVNYETRVAQYYPLLFSIVLRNESSAQFASSLVSNLIGGAPNGTLKTSTLNISTLMPFITRRTGVAFVYASCYDKDPAAGGFAWCPRARP